MRHHHLAEHVSEIRGDRKVAAFETIAHRKAIDQLRGATRRPRPSGDLPEIPTVDQPPEPDDELRDALEHRRLVELRAMLRPAEDLALYRADMADWPGELRGWRKDLRDWVAANDACRRDFLGRLKTSGPLTMRELPDTCAVPWGSTGWTNNRNVEKLLGFMVQRGEVAVAGRQGRERLWDLASRVYPDDPVVPA